MDIFTASFQPSVQSISLFAFKVMQEMDMTIAFCQYIIIAVVYIHDVYDAAWVSK